MLATFIFLTAPIPSAKQENKKVSLDVYENLKNKNQVRVIIEIKEEGFFGIKKNISKIESDIISELKPNKVTKNKKSISTEINNKDLELLENNKDIEFIILDQIAEIFLQDSVPQINATTTWSLQINGTNLTGADQTVCIIDTGINSTHPDLLNKVLDQYCYCSAYEGSNDYCCSDGSDENNNAKDTNSHGTHVAGIISANGTIKGVAPESKLVIIKTMNSSGSGYYSDIKKGIEWCTNNATKYNISIISLSLGSGLYSNYCNTDYLATSINTAIEKNISVIVSTGNSGSTTQISSPSCVQNATAVSAVSKTDAIASSYANRNSLTDLVAPGGLGTNSQTKINSTYRTGGYYQTYGTSMSTPHVSGAFAIVRQFFIKENNRIPTPQEIQNILNKTGKIIYDSGTGLNFSRIDVYNAVLSIDNTFPNVTLSYPINNYLSQEKNLNFSCNTSDNLQLKNVSLIIWDSQSNIEYSVTNITSLNSFYSFINLSNVSYGNYQWNCLAYDMAGNLSYSPSNFSFYIGNISSSLITPQNNYISNNSTNNFSCLSQTADIFSLSNITFYLWNSSGYLINETKINITGNINTTTFNYTFSNQGNYSWNCVAFNNYSQSSLMENNYTFIFHNITPIITSITNSITTSSATINWITDENTNSTINYGTTVKLGTIISNQTLTTNKSVLLSGLSSSTNYYYNVTSCDEFNLCITNGTYSFTTSTSETQEKISGGGGGGSGSGSGGGTSASAGTVYIVTLEETNLGLTKLLSNLDKISFTILNNKQNETHTLSIESISNNSIKIKIQSIIITDELSINETGKYEITGNDIYNIQVKLNSILNNKCNLTIKSINEKIIAQTHSETINENNQNLEKNISTTEINSQINQEESKSNKWIVLITLGVIIIIISTIFIVINRFKEESFRIKKRFFKKNIFK